MSNNNKTTITFGGDTMAMLGIAFIVLKLCDVIDWSWWWVLAPFWGPLSLAIFIFVIYCMLLIVEEMVKK